MPKAQPAIELHATPKHFLGLPPAQFLSRYWQQRPLLIRQAFPDFESPLTPDDLAGLACEAMATSRLIVETPATGAWNVRQGPFVEADFSKLPSTHWTLLVQDCDKLLAEVDEIFARFRFLPDWRLDDIMISYAEDGGSVGAHVDQYDVFLLQGMGKRHWAISTDPHAPKAFRPDVELKLLREFSPTHEWVLEPGDMLYLPPGVPHHGVALGECMTFSIGLRAPSVAEMLLDFVESRAENLDDAWRYADPDLSSPKDAAEIDDAAVDKVQGLLRRALRADPEATHDWFARFITRYRAAHQPVPAEQTIDARALQQHVSAGASVHRSPWSRYAFRRNGHAAAMYLAGERYDGSLRLARLLQTGKVYDGEALGALNNAEWGTLAELINAGHLVISDD